MNDSKEYIISIATKLFLQKSFKEVTMKKIIETTGMSKGAIYHYFDSKEKLFKEVAEFFLTHFLIHEYDKYKKDSLYNYYHDYANRLLLYNNDFLKTLNIANEGKSFNYFILLRDALILIPEFYEQILELQKKDLSIWSSVIKNARQKGEIESVMNDEQLALLFSYLNDGVTIQNMILNTNYSETAPVTLSLWNRLYEQIKKTKKQEAFLI